jgi:hypothetical protein
MSVATIYYYVYYVYYVDLNGTIHSFIELSYLRYVNVLLKEE